MEHLIFYVGEGAVKNNTYIFQKEELLIYVGERIIILLMFYVGKVKLLYITVSHMLLRRT